MLASELLQLEVHELNRRWFLLVMIFWNYVKNCKRPPAKILQSHAKSFVCHSSNVLNAKAVRSKRFDQSSVAELRM